MGKDKHKHKDRSKDKHRSKRRDSSSDDDSERSRSRSRERGAHPAEDEARRRRKAEDKARKIAKMMRGQKEVVPPAGAAAAAAAMGLDDAAVATRFVWEKKITKQVLEGVDPREFSRKAEKRRAEERLEEVEKVKARRAAREEERAQLDDEMGRLQRERDAAEAIGLEQKEAAFHLKTARLRSEIRLREGRARPIDLLAAALRCGPGGDGNDESDAADAGLDAPPPDDIFRGLGTRELAELAADVSDYAGLDTGTQERREFWAAMVTVCAAEAAEAERLESGIRRGGNGGRLESMPRHDGLHAGVAEGIDEALQGKTTGQLRAMRGDIADRVASGEATDADYWAAVGAKIDVAIARARLREIYESRLLARMFAGPRPGTRGEAGGGGAGAEGAERAGAEEGAERGAEAAEGGDEGRPSPGELSPAGRPLGRGEAAVDAAMDWARLLAARAAVAAARGGRPRPGAEGPARVAAAAEANGAVGGEGGGEGGALDADELALRTLASKIMGPTETGEEAFQDGEIDVASAGEAYWWHDKYRPRKPKYFNRVHTGYEWNKYNQTHYDHDNPPPKVVQGYKFNVFYPDLIDKIKAPTYTIVPEAGAKWAETAILTFRAGPPYEDIAFRIVNKEWEYGHKKGFKCTFDRGIMHLYFNFARHRYRR